MFDLRDYPELSAEFVARHPADDPRFERWLEAWYGAPISEGFWAREPEDDGLEHCREAVEDGETFVLFIARSWSMGHALLERFSPDQVGQTVYALVNQFRWPTSPENGERVMWDAVRILFREVLIPFAGDSLCHLSEPNTEISATLYMFWDVAGWPSWSATPLGRGAFLVLIEECLNSPKAAVQESALHGIGEYTPWDQEGKGDVPEASRLARRFAEVGRTSRPELREYADRAARGMVL